jgi:Flp pilus assembly protein TadD
MDNGALDAFKQVVQYYPESDQALVGLAAAQTFLGKLDEAEKSLREALAKNERNIEAHHNLGLVLMSRNDLDGARRELGRALELRPDHLEDLVWLARITLQQGKEQESRDWIARARAAHPDSTAPLVLEATIAAKHDQPAEALKLVDQALDLNRDDGEGLLLKGKLHHQLGQDNSARQALARACELLPTSFEANFNMGQLTVKVSPEEALPYLVRAYELRAPDKIAEDLRNQLRTFHFRAARTPIDLARADLARENVSGASEWLAKAQAVEPENGEVRQLAGDLALRRGALDEAERELLEACRLLPTNLDAHLSLAQVYIGENKQAEARSTLEKLLGIVKRQGTGAMQDEMIRREARNMLEALGK